MTDHTFRRELDAATGYQELLVPALMEEWAPQVADAAGIRPGDRVLDVACGTGVLTREAAIRAGPTGAVTGLDLSPEMLAVAARLSPALRWQQGSAEALPFADHSFDAVVSQFGLMFFPDPVAGLREMMRVLALGGRLAVAVWGSLADTPAYAAETDVRDWLHIVGVTLHEDLIETILRESETALRPFLTIEKQGVGFDSPAVLATAMR